MQMHNILSIVYAKQGGFACGKSLKRQSGKKRRQSKPALSLFFHDLQNLHRTRLGANTAGNAFGSGRIFFLDNNLNRTYFRAFPAASTKFLIDHICTFGILGNSARFAGFGAKATLQADTGFDASILLQDPNAGKRRMERFVKRLRTRSNAFQAGHAGGVFFYSQFFHISSAPCFSVCYLLYTKRGEKQEKHLLPLRMKKERTHFPLLLFFTKNEAANNPTIKII